MSELLLMSEAFILKLDPVLVLRNRGFEVNQMERTFRMNLFAMSHFDPKIIRQILNW